MRLPVAKHALPSRRSAMTQALLRRAHWCAWQCHAAVVRLPGKRLLTAGRPCAGAAQRQGATREHGAAGGQRRQHADNAFKGAHCFGQAMSAPLP